MIGKLAAKLPSKPQGITIGGIVYLTSNYNRVRNLYHAGGGAEAAKIYEFGMFAHETYHAIDQELTSSFPLLKGSGKWKWLLKYLLKLIKTPDAHKHPMEVPAYSFGKYLKLRAKNSEIKYTQNDTFSLQTEAEIPNNFRLRRPNPVPETSVLKNPPLIPICTQ